MGIRGTEDSKGRGMRVGTRAWNGLASRHKGSRLKGGPKASTLSGHLFVFAHGSRGQSPSPSAEVAKPRLAPLLCGGCIRTWPPVHGTVSAVQGQPQLRFRNVQQATESHPSAGPITEFPPSCCAGLRVGGSLIF